MFKTGLTSHRHIEAISVTSLPYHQGLHNMLCNTRKYLGDLTRCCCCSLEVVQDFCRHSHCSCSRPSTERDDRELDEAKLDFAVVHGIYKQTVE